MDGAQFESTFHNPWVALLIGTAVSLDVIALTFCSTHIYRADPRTWRRWAKYNACWHAGLLLTYLILIDVFAVAAQYLGLLLTFDLPPWLAVFKTPWEWFRDRFNSHIVVYAAALAMMYVWFQYTSKIISRPTSPDPKESPFFLRKHFYRHQAKLRDPNSRVFWNLSACLVAVDMLALAAVVKSGEKLIQFPEGINARETTIHQLNERVSQSFNPTFLAATITVTIAVFVVVWLLCLLSAYLSRRFWSDLASSDSFGQGAVAATFIVVLLRLLEPLVIFYFIVHSMAFLATGVPLHSPAFLLGSSFLVAALVQYSKFSEIVAAARDQVETSSLREKEHLNDQK